MTERFGLMDRSPAQGTATASTTDALRERPTLANQQWDWTRCGIECTSNVHIIAFTCLY